MKKIFSFLKKNILVIAISFSLGGFVGYKVLESLGIAFLINSIPYISKILVYFVFSVV